MQTILSEDCIYNILGHIKDCWETDYPNSKNLENAFFKGLLPFYPNSKLLGSPTTIVDAGKDSDAFDIKGCKSLNHVFGLTRNSNQIENYYHTQTLPNGNKVIVKIPKSINTQVRRPNVDLESYKGNAKVILENQVLDYHVFAINSIAKDGYENLYSVVLLYGIDKGYKSIFLTIEDFSIPAIETTKVGVKKDGTPCSYNGLDAEGNVVFTLSSFNRGSSNFVKRFETSSGILMTWEDKSKQDIIHTKNSLQKECCISKI